MGVEIPQGDMNTNLITDTITSILAHLKAHNTHKRVLLHCGAARRQGVCAHSGEVPRVHHAHSTTLHLCVLYIECRCPAGRMIDGTRPSQVATSGRTSRPLRSHYKNRPGYLFYRYTMLESARFLPASFPGVGP